MGDGTGDIYIKAGGVVISFALVLILSLVALFLRPPSTLLDHRLVPGSVTCEAGEAGNEGWWHIRLEIDRDYVQEPWTLVEDAPSAYRLEWIPAARIVRLVRSGPGPRVLGALQLQAAPRQVVWRRHGDVLQVQCDERPPLRCLDLLPPDPGSTWRLETPGEFGRSELFIHDDRHILATSGKLAKGLELRRLLRGQIEVLSGSTTGVDQSILLQATRFVENLSLDDDIRAQAMSWVIWAAGVGGIRNTDAFSFEDLDTSIRRFAELANRHRVPPQTAGILMHLIGELVARITAPADRRHRARVIITHRREALDLVEAISTFLGLMAQSGQQPFMEEDLQDILLLKHLAQCLAGHRDQDATPVNAPRWLLSRWKAVTPSLPIEDPLPTIPFREERTPYLRPALMALLDHARLDRLPEVIMRAEIHDHLAEGTLAEHLPGILHDGLPERERELTRLILLASGRWRPEDPSAVLVDETGTPRPAVVGDPLAYALARLAVKRLKLNRPGLETLPPGLTAESRLLAGDDQSLTQVFGRGTGALPPEQLLAAALAMQEVVRGDAEWSLLAAMPCMYLPLGLLVPEP